MMFAKKQTGMSLIGTLIILGFVVFLAYLMLIIVPVYMDDQQAQKIVGNLNEKEANFFGLSQQGIIDSVDRRFGISSIYNIKPREILKVKTGGGKVEIQMHYDRELPIAGNLFVVMKFRHDYEFSK